MTGNGGALPLAAAGLLIPMIAGAAMALFGVRRLHSLRASLPPAGLPHVDGGVETAAPSRGVLTGSSR